MDSIDKSSMDIKEEKLKELQKILPNVFSEGKLDINQLKSFFDENQQALDEKYSFGWAGKKESFLNLQTSAKGTLVPMKNESIKFEDSDNIFIEGDNLEVLKLLQKSYFEKI